MALIKPPSDWSEEVSGFYDGPPPPAGTYTCEVTRMGLGKIQSGENEGKQKIVVAVQIKQGKYKGAGSVTGFPLLKQNAWSLNQFLMSMTDGSEKQKAGIRKVFWTKGFKCEDEAANEKLGRQIQFIGSSKFVPIGKTVHCVLKPNGDRTEIEKFLIPLEGGGSVEPESEEAEEDSLSEVAEAAEEVAEETASDDDDPWS